MVLVSASRSTPGSQTAPVEPPPGWSLADGRGGGIDELRARETIKHALFGSLPHAVRIGRYELEREIGAGGLGVVFAARDPELDRIVAIKLMRGTGSPSARRTARLVREAQTLARVSHPNVVAVYDVGTYDGGPDWPLGEETPSEGVYIVMEYVEGVELRAWLRESVHPWTEVLRTCLAAGRGLAAAHAVGLVHRDFKPSNVLVGIDGRARVVDFGLARAVGPSSRVDSRSEADAGAHDATLTLSGWALGTPAYMPPEQHANGRTDERADQYAFCVTLWEALYGERPFGGATLASLVAAKYAGKVRTPPASTEVPDAIRIALERGLRALPGERWPSMHVLLATLERIGRPRVRRRLVGLAVVGASLFAVAWLRAPGVARCEDGVAAMDGVWDEQRRNDLRAAILGVDVVWAPTAANQVEAAMDAFAARWRSSHADLCAAKGDADFDAGMTCLRDHLRRANAFVEVLLAADSHALERAVENAAALPDPHRCAVRPDRQAASDGRAEAIRDAIATAEALLHAGRYDAAYDAALRAETLASRSGDPALRADALVLLGKTRSERGDWTGAETTLEEAYWLASEHGHDAAAAEAALMLVVATSESSSRYEDAKRWAEHARSIYGRIDAEPTALGRLHAALGGLEYRRGDYPAAVEHARESVRLFEAEVGPDDPRLSTALGNLGGMLAMRGEFAEAEVVQRRALEIRERALGKEHPEVAQALHTLAACVAGAGRAKEALPLQRRAVQLWERSLGDDHPLVAMGLNNLGTLSEQLGDDETAMRSHERALEIREARLGSDHPDVGVSLLNVGVAYQQVGRNDDARAALERALSILRSALGDAHDHVAYAEMAYGSQLRRDGELERARDLLRHATSVFEATPGNPQAPIAQAELGGTLVELGQTSEAIPLLEAALAGAAHGAFGPLQRTTARFDLARALWNRAPDRERARTLVGEAQHDLANAELHGRQDEQRRRMLVELDAWQREH